MIAGVKVKKLRKIKDSRGFLMEILRKDDLFFRQFGQVYITACNPETAKAWHAHKKQTDHFAVIAGNATMVLYDARKKSKTYGQVNEFNIGEKNPLLILIPPNVFHGFECSGKKTCYAINCPDKVYSYKKPDEIRKPFNTKEIPYNWNAKKGG